LKRRILIAILTLLVIAGGLSGYFYFNSTSATSSIAAQSLDDINIQLDEEMASNSSIQPESESSSINQPKETLEKPVPQSASIEISQQTDESPSEPFQYNGTLIMVADDHVFGEEQFRLSRDENGTYKLLSTGFFQFKVVLVNAKLPFQQGIRWDNELYPRFLSFRLDGPLGVGSKDFDISFTAEEPYRTGSMRVGDQHEDFRMPDGEVAIQGTFSTFALVPYLLADREEARVELIIANSFGPENSTGATANEVIFRQLGTASVRDAQRELIVDEYELAEPEDELESDSPRGRLRILFHKNEIIAIYAKSDDRRADGFLIYRGDLFSVNIEIESEN